MDNDWKSRAEAAETTVTVLKRKVTQLYNGEAASTIQRQLERSKDRQEETRRRHGLTRVRSEALAKYTHELEGEVAERTRALRMILDNVTSGFLVVDDNLMIAPGFTLSCESLLAATEIAGRDVGDVLASGDPRLANHLRLGLAQVFADLFPEEVSLDLLPRRIAFGDRSLRIDARAIRDDSGVLKRVLLTINDITTLERAERESREHKVLIGALKQREAFTSFISDARELLSASKEAIADGNHSFYRRALHTLKGNAAAFDLTRVVATIHAVESLPVVSLVDVQNVENEVRAFLVKHRDVLEIDYDAVATISFDVPEDKVAALASLARPEDHSVRNWLADIVLRRAEDVLGPLETYIGKLAERLEKKVDFTLVGGDVLVDARRLRSISRNLTHLIRNSVAHGIENPDDRQDKPPTGRVEVRVEDSSDEWMIRVSDDGRGIDTERLVELAVQRRIVSHEAAKAMSHEQKLMLVFHEGLSTADEANEVAGRGVGMSSVKAAIEEQNGTIGISSVSGSGTKIELRVPKEAPPSSRAPVSRTPSLRPSARPQASARA